MKLRELWVLTLLIKLLLSAFLPINADEAYYWVWSHHMQLSYYDHPAAVAWLFYLGHWLEPFANAVRWPAVILGHLTLGIWLQLLAPYLSEQRRRWFLWLMVFSPLMGPGSLIITPDVPVMFFWSAALYFFLKAERENRLKDYVLLGAALGFGFCAKYHIVLFLPPLFFYLLIEQRWREIRWRYVPITIIVGLICCLPVLLWNSEHDWISFRFQLAHGLEAQKNKPEWIVRYVLGEIALLFPLVFWAALRSRPVRELRALIYFAWFPFLFFFMTSFRGFVEANWPIIGFPSVMALAVADTAGGEKFWQNPGRWLKSYVAFWGGVLAIVLSALFLPGLRTMSEHLVNAIEYQKLAETLKPYRPLYAQTHQWASTLTYFSKEPIYKLRGINRLDFFDFIEESKPQVDHFYLVARPSETMPEWLAREGWSWQLISKISDRYELLEFKKNSMR
jgi:4-amino-4-deoxy-L-arabinose transferase-like glycosyltransferase